MSSSSMELDFFRMEKESATSLVPPPKKRFERLRSFRDIQHVVSRISPEVLKNVIARSSVPSTPKEDQTSFSPLPVYIPTPRQGYGFHKGVDTSPLTIFYNGTVAVFDVPPDKAENILKRAEEATDSKFTFSLSDKNQLLAKLDNGDLPMARRKSLERFLEKRKERLTFASPYGCCPSPTNSVFAGENAYAN